MSGLRSVDAENTESDQIQVLHVDDDPQFTELTATFLERDTDALVVTTASSASDGLDQLAGSTIDCIVSDYDMPGQNGIQFLEAVREDYSDLPFILFTGKGSEEIASDAISAGATDYLQKEGGTDQYSVLANRVTNYAEKYRAEREMARRSQAMKTVNEGIAIVDEDGRYVEVNEAYAEFYGAHADEMVGEHWTLTVPSGEADRLQTEVFPRLEELGEWTGEAVGQRVDGDTYPKLISLALLDGGGHVCVIRDITEQKDREHTLRQLKGEFETVFNTAQDALFLFDVVETESRYEFKLRRLNPAHEAISGLSSEDLRGATPREIVGEEQGAEVAANFRRCVEAEEPIAYEEVLEMPSRTINWHTKLAPVRKDGEVTQIVGVARDITDQKAREEELERYQQLVDAMLDPACIFNMDGRFEIVNQALAELYDKSPSDLVGDESSLVRQIRTESEGDPYRELITGDRDELRGEYTPEFLDHERTIEYRLSRLRIDGEVAGIVAVSRDITERKTRERELGDLERYNREILENAPVGLFRLDDQMRITYENQRAEEIVGVPEGADGSPALGKDLRELPAVQNTGVIDALNRLESGETVSFDTWFESNFGKESYLTGKGVPLFDGDGFDGAIIMAVDITERKETEQILEQLRQNITDVVWMTTPEKDSMDFISDAYRDIMGRSPESLREDPLAFVDAVHLEDGDRVRAALKEQQHDPDAYEETYRIIRPDGEQRWVHDRSSGVYEDGELTRIVGIASDITEQKRHELELQRKNNRLEEFSSVLSHDLRNPLSVAAVNLQLAIEEDDRELLGSVARAHDRMKSLIDDMLSLAKAVKTVGATEAIDLATLTEGCWQNVETRSATLVADADITIQADELRLKQLVENLLRNAVDHGGDEVTVHVGDLPGGFYVEDDGSGIPADERTDVFEAGYSTRETGTGFGLSIVHDIAEAHGWEVRMTDGDEGGARFEFTGVEAE